MCQMHAHDVPVFGPHTVVTSLNVYHVNHFLTVVLTQIF